MPFLGIHWAANTNSPTEDVMADYWDAVDAGFVPDKVQSEVREYVQRADRANAVWERGAQEGGFRAAFKRSFYSGDEITALQGANVLINEWVKKYRKKQGWDNWNF